MWHHAESFARGMQWNSYDVINSQDTMKLLSKNLLFLQTLFDLEKPNIVCTLFILNYFYKYDYFFFFFLTRSSQITAFYFIKGLTVKSAHPPAPTLALSKSMLWRNIEHFLKKCTCNWNFFIIISKGLVFL